MARSLPLSGVRIIEIAGIGPGPFCGMMLADNGAEVIRVDRAGGLGAGVPIDGEKDVMLRSRRSIALDLKSPAGVEIVQRLVTTADALFEGFRPGVMERLGLGPEPMLALNPSLVYGRMTGWGQDGPHAQLPGHDINYIAINGALDAIGRRDQAPVAPLNLLGDFGGGGLLLAFGMVSALLAVRAGAAGRVVDCSMAEGASALMAGIWSLKHNGLWDGERGSNLLDGGAPFYDSYRTGDGRWFAVGAIEGKFHDRLCALLGLADDPDFADQHDRQRWPAMRRKLEQRFAASNSDELAALLAGEEVCTAPILSLDEAPQHPQNQARGSFLKVNGLLQPAPVPHYPDTPRPTPHMWQENSDQDSLLAELGYNAAEIDRLASAGAFGTPTPVAAVSPPL